jgi:hypothetical protein
MYNYYEILGVKQTATEQQIKKAYRELIQIYHPDKIPNDPHALEFTKLLNEAYSVLVNPLKRKEFDNLLSLRNAQKEKRDYAQRTEEMAEPRAEAEAEVHHYRCEKCGKQDSSLRVAIFLGVFSFLVVTFKKAHAYILCAQCRIKYSLLFNLEVLFLGWWGIPWGPAYSIAALYENMKGGEQPQRNNEALLNILAYDFYRQGRHSEAYECIQESITIEWSKEKEEFLNYLKTLTFKRKVQTFTDKFVLKPLFYNIILFLGLISFSYVLLSVSGSNTTNTYRTPHYSLPSTYSTSSPSTSEAAHITLPDIETGYIKGFTQKRKAGYSELTVDNTQNNEGVIAKIFYVGGARPEAVRAFSIRGGDKFTAQNLSPGEYEVRYKMLGSNLKYKTEPIMLQQIEEINSIRYSSVEITLYKVPFGNMETYPISDADFEME